MDSGAQHLMCWAQHLTFIQLQNVVAAAIVVIIITHTKNITVHLDLC